MKKLLAEIKFQTSYYYKNVRSYFATVLRSLTGTTTKQISFLEELLDNSIAVTERLYKENAKLQDELTKLKAKSKALKKISEGK